MRAGNNLATTGGKFMELITKEQIHDILDDWMTPDGKEKYLSELSQLLYDAIPNIKFPERREEYGGTHADVQQSIGFNQCYDEFKRLNKVVDDER